MARPQPVYPFDRVIKFTEAEGPDRDNLPQNPLSPFTSSYPSVPRNETPGPSQQPLFAIGQDWLGPVGGGTGSESPYVPPDTMGDVSPTQVVVTVNGRFKSYDRFGNLGALNTDPNTFFASVRSSSMSDPRVRWDRLTQRWYIVMIDVTSINNRVCIAVSNGPQITDASSFTFYQFVYNLGNTSVSGFLDYPTIGIDANAIYICGNIFTSVTGSFSGCDVFVVNKASLLGGSLVVTPFRQICTAAGVGVFTPHGCDNDDPASNEGYVLGVAGNSFGLLKLRKISTPGGTPSISGDFNITVPATLNGRTVTASGSSNPLSGLDDRLFAAKLFWNRLTNTPSIWAAHNIRGDNTGVANSSGDRNLSRWYEIRGFMGGGSPSLFQSGTVFSNSATALSYWIPSVAMNCQGHALLGSSYAGTTVTPNTAEADRLSSDPLGSMNTPVQVTSSTAIYNRQSGTQRWGDYSHTAVDPADGMSFWTFQEYCSAANQWGVRVTQLLAPGPTITSASPNNAYPFDNPTVTLTGTGLFDPGAGYPNHLNASVSGSGVTVNSISFVSPTQATVSLSLAGTAAAGPRALTVTNPDGQFVSTTFTVNARAATGTVTLGDYPSPTSVMVTFQIKDAANNVLQTAMVQLDSQGRYSFVPAVAPGTYTVTAKASHWLRRAVAGVTITSAGFSSVNFSLINGDVNGDNIISLADFAELRNAYGSTPASSNWDANADLNGDLAVSLADFAILRSNFGLQGD